MRSNDHSSISKEARHQSDQQGWVELIGTPPRFRRRGLGQALLLTGLQRLRLHGVDTALLGTTSWNTPAQQLYEMSGFRTIYQVHWYTWDVEAQARWRTV